MCSLHASEEEMVLCSMIILFINFAIVVPTLYSNPLKLRGGEKIQFSVVAHILMTTIFLAIFLPVTSVRHKLFYRWKSTCALLRLVTGIAPSNFRAAFWTNVFISCSFFACFASTDELRKRENFLDEFCMLVMTLGCLATVEGTLVAGVESEVKREWATGEHSVSLSLLKLVW